jgi:hypothetical protein
VAWANGAALVVLQALYAYTPVTQEMFGSAAIGPREWALTAALAVAIFLLTEAAKAVGRRRVVRASVPD